MSASKRFHIEIEVDNIDSDERMQAATDAIQIVGGQAYTMMMLIVGDKPPPQITMWAEDFETGKTDLPLQKEETDAEG